VDPSDSLLKAADTAQLCGIVIILILIVVVGCRIAGQGPKGFASGLMEVAALFVACMLVLNPSGVLTTLGGFTGGIHKPTMPAVSAARTDAAIYQFDRIERV
jgi:hypothetical protein